MSLLKIKSFSIDLTDTFTFANANVVGNIISGNATLGNLTTSNYFTGNGSLLSSITGSNVSGQVGNALVAGTVYTAAQPSITSLGTLTGLTSGGIVNFNSASNVTLGAVGNIHITGGTAGYYLQTDGSGGLSWSAVSAGTGNANIAGSNTQIFFNDAGSSALGAKSTFTFDKSTDTLSVTNITANGAGITYITGANVSGNVALAVQSHYANIANSIAGANVSGNVTSAVQSHYANIANSVAGSNVSGNVTSAVQSHYANIANSVSGSNVVGQVTYAATANSVAGANVSGQVTYAATANSVAGANVSGNVTSAVQSHYANIANSVAGSNVSGNVTSAVQSHYANIANSVAWSNVSSTPTTISGYGITDAYSNTNAGAYISSYSGDLSGANLTLTGNLVISGTTTSVNSTVTRVVDPIFELGGGANGAALSTDDNKDRGVLLHYYSGGSTVDAFMGWDDSNGEFGFGSAVTVASEVITFTTYGNLHAGYFIGNGSTLTSITGANVSGNVTSAVQSHYANIANSVSGSNVSGAVAQATYADTANSVAGANVSGNVASAVQSHYANIANSVAGSNVSGQVGNALVAGTVYTAAQPSITSVGTLTGLTSTGTIDLTGAGNVSLGAVGNIHISGGSANYYLKTDGSGSLSWSSLPSTTMTVDSYTGDGSWTMKTLTVTPVSSSYTLVAIGGVFQPRTAYSLSGAVITFSDPPPNGAIVEITTLVGGTAGGGGGASWTYSAINANTTAVAGYRYIVDTSSANITITLPASATLGDEVMIIDGTGTASTHEITVDKNGGKIQGSASNMTVNTNRAAFTLVYYNSAQGWILTNV